MFNEVKKFRLCSLRAFSSHRLLQQFNDLDHLAIQLKTRLTKLKNDTFVSDCEFASSHVR